MMSVAAPEALTPEHEAFFQDGFNRHAVSRTGMAGSNNAPVVFAVRDGQGRLQAGVTVKLYWGQLHIKNVFCAEDVRGQGVTRQIMQQAHDYGRAHGCHFAFVETLSFQAEGFYQKLGYVTEFIRHGFANDVSFIYMRKDLKDTAHA